jgi:hypothetical protein
MSTTALAVEFLIIGYHTLIWVLLAACLLPACDEVMLRNLKDWKELLIGGSVVVAYTFGAVMNGVASKIMEKMERKLMKDKDPKPSEMRATILVRKPEAYEEVMKFFVVPRVLRSTIINFAFTGLFAVIHSLILATSIWPQPVFVFLIFALVTGFAYWGWRESCENFYIHLSATYDALTRNEQPKTKSKTDNPTDDAT